MEIEIKKRREETTYGKLQIGQVFKQDGTFFLKVSSMFDNEDGYGVPLGRNESGEHYDKYVLCVFTNDETVELADAKITIYD